MSEARVTQGPDSENTDRFPQKPGDTPAPVESNTPGAVLRRTREAHGQSIADVVQAIRFSPRQIEALERDDYASLPGATVARGLVRNYSKFLKLDPAPLLAQLEPVVPLPRGDVRPPGNMGEAERPTIVQRVPPSVVALVIVLLLLALVGYGYSSLPSRDVEGVLTRLMASLAGRAPGANPAAAPRPAPPVAVAPAPSPAASSGAPAAVPEVTPAVAPPAGEAAAPLASAAGGPAGEKVGAPPAVGLRVEFDDVSWIEIRDASQNVVLAGEYPAGTRRDVEGKAPFQVWIGKASAVRLYMGERGIDLKPYTRAEIARFTLE